MRLNSATVKVRFSAKPDRVALFKPKLSRTEKALIGLAILPVVPVILVLATLNGVAKVVKKIAN